MKFNIKSLLIFAVIYSSIYSTLISSFTSIYNIKDNASFDFLNAQFLISKNFNLLSGNQWQIDILGGIINLSYIPLIFSYFLLPFTFIIYLFLNIYYVFQYAIQILNIPSTILPYGIGILLDSIFYAVLLIMMLLSIQIIATGIRESD